MSRRPRRVPVAPMGFDPGCRRCPRLAEFLDEVKREHPGYHARPVPAFGAASPRLLIIGLAPGMHGANATGRPFTGDFAGILLYNTLYDMGFSTRPESRSASDRLRLQQCRITNAVKCLPPQNRPTTAEIKTCNVYLAEEVAQMPAGSVLLALGTVAHHAVLRALDLRAKAFPFAHGAEHPLTGERLLIDSYHCSRYNTQTGRLTEAMFRAVFERAREFLGLTAARGR